MALSADSGLGETAPLTNGYYMALYLCVTVLLTMLAGLLFYVLCSQRFKLNWFEKNQLTQSMEKSQQGNQHDILPTVHTPENILDPKTEKFLKSQGTVVDDKSPTGQECINQVAGPSGGQFWVPPSLKRQASICQSDGPNDLSGDESTPGTPSTPLNLKVSPFSSPVEKVGHVVKYVQPPSASSVQASRPRVTSMYSKLDHTKIDTTMYDPNAHAEPESPVEASKGSVKFSLSFKKDFSLLCVHVYQVLQLPAREFSGAADPYVKVRLLPDRLSRQSSVHRKTLNPTFDEEFVFDVAEDRLDQKTVELLVFDYDQYSRHECMGHVLLPLEGLQLQGEERGLPFWKAIQPCQDVSDQPDIGHLMFSLGYLPSAERLTVVILKARDLKAMDETKKTSDAYVKVSLILDGKRLKKKKTSTLRASLNPVFNEALTFNVAKDQLKNVALELAVVHDGPLGQKLVLGTVLLTSDSKGPQGDHLRALSSSKSALAMWHTLVPPPPS